MIEGGNGGTGLERAQNTLVRLELMLCRKVRGGCFKLKCRFGPDYGEPYNTE